MGPPALGIGAPGMDAVGAVGGQGATGVGTADGMAGVPEGHGIAAARMVGEGEDA